MRFQNSELYLNDVLWDISLWLLARAADRRQRAGKTPKCQQILLLPTRPQVRPVSWSRTRGFHLTPPESGVWFCFLQYYPLPRAGLLICLEPQVCHSDLLSPPHIPIPDSCSKAPNTPPPLLIRSPWHHSWAQRSTCWTRLTTGPVPQGAPCPKAKSSLQVPAPLVRPELPPSASRYWMRRLQVSWNPPACPGRVLSIWSTIKKVFLTINWSVSEYNFHLRFWFCHLLSL